MDASESFTCWSASGARGEVLDLCRLVTEIALVFLKSLKIGASGFRVVGVGRGCEPLGGGIHFAKAVVLSSVVYSQTESQLTMF